MWSPLWEEKRSFSGGSRPLSSSSATSRIFFSISFTREGLFSLVFLPAVQLCCHTVAGHCLWRGVTKVWPLKQLIFPSISVDLVPVVLIEVDKKGEMEKKGQWRLRQRVTQVEFIKIKLKIRSQKRTWSPTTHLKQQLVLWARGLHSILDREALSLVSLICSRYNPRVAWCSDAAACVPVSWCYSKVPLYKKTHCRESVSQSAR